MEDRHLGMVEARGSNKKHSDYASIEIPLRSTERRVGMNKIVMYGTVGLMFLLLAVLVVADMGSESWRIVLILFSGTIAFSAMFFGDWFPQAKD